MNKTIIAIFLVISSITFSQEKKHKDSEFKKHPYWIEMIKDPNVNYFEALKAYELFWQGKEIPLEEEDKIGQKKSAEHKEEIGYLERRERKKERALQEKYGLECKKFEHWKMMVKPYIQEDGSILSKEDQLKIWEQQKQR